MRSKDIEIGKYYLGAGNHIRLVVFAGETSFSEGDAATYVTVYPPPPRTGQNLSTMTKRSFAKWAKREVQPVWLEPFRQCEECGTYHMVPEYVKINCNHCGHEYQRKVVTACPPAPK